MIETTWIANNSEGGFRYIINQLACAGICIFMTLPYLRNRLGLYFLIFAFGVWLITTDLKWLAEKPPKDFIFLALFFATFIPYIVTHKLGYGAFGIKTLTVIVPIFFLGYIINQYYMHYKRDYNSLGKIALVSLVCYIIGSIQTYLGLLQYPGASRSLAGGVYEQSADLAALYMKLGIGGFGYIYAASLIFIASFYFFTKGSASINKKYKAICVVSMLLMVVMIFKASYATAILSIVLGIVLTLVVKNTKSLVLFMIFTAVFLLMFPQELIGEFLLRIAKLFSGNETLYKRFAILASGFLPNDSIVEQGVTRSELYLTSLKTFLMHPLFGVYGPFGGGEDPNSVFVIGGHSGWLDLLGFYGLFAGVPLFLSIYFHIKKQLDFFKDSKCLGLIVIVSFMFIVLGAINPIITVYDIGFAQFCIVPAIPFLGNAFTPNSDRPEGIELPGAVNAKRTGIGH